MSKIGSPEWFREKANTQQKERFKNNIETLRAAFIDQFSPAALLKMSGAELLDRVFGNDDYSMMQLLIMDNYNYRNFGACGYKYLSPLYMTVEGVWKYKDKNKAVRIFEYEAVTKAEMVRDMICECISKIERIGSFKTLAHYSELERSVSHIPFYKYIWALKYFQMLFPNTFPGMYADNTLKRAIDIIGLPFHGKSERLLNMGEIALFIKRCDINNIVFNEIYADEWTWNDYRRPCENASENYTAAALPVNNDNLSHYRFSLANNGQLKTDAHNAHIDEAINIDTDLDRLNLQGAEREAMVKVRVNQGVFRKMLLRKYNECRLCKVSDQSLLTASHIKPWAASDDEEKLDDENGFLFCPNHDKLFDQGFISFTDEGKIMISLSLSENDRTAMKVDSAMSIELSQRNRQYLAYHRENIFRR